MDLPRRYVIRESTHRIHNPLGAAKLDRAARDHVVAREHVGWGVFAFIAR